MITIKITEEMIEESKRRVMQRVRVAKPKYEKKSTEELLKEFEEQAHMHSYMSVGSWDDVIFVTTRVILLERGKEDDVRRILEEAEETGKKVWNERNI